VRHFSFCVAPGACCSRSGRMALLSILSPSLLKVFFIPPRRAFSRRCHSAVFHPRRFATEQFPAPSEGPFCEGVVLLRSLLLFFLFDSFFSKPLGFIILATSSEVPSITEPLPFPSRVCVLLGRLRPSLLSIPPGGSRQRSYFKACWACVQFLSFPFVCIISPPNLFSTTFSKELGLFYLRKSSKVVYIEIFSLPPPPPPSPFSFFFFPPSDYLPRRSRCLFFCVSTTGTIYCLALLLGELFLYPCWDTPLPPFFLLCSVQPDVNPRCFECRLRPSKWSFPVFFPPLPLSGSFPFPDSLN